MKIMFEFLDSLIGGIILGFIPLAAGHINCHNFPRSLSLLGFGALPFGLGVCNRDDLRITTLQIESARVMQNSEERHDYELSCQR
jgi:hypothetical protein